jgi:hypothetical protein
MAYDEVRELSPNATGEVIQNSALQFSRLEVNCTFKVRLRGGMIRLFSMFLIIGLSAAASAAEIYNTDSQSYELILVQPGYRQDVRVPYQLLEHSRTTICEYGCDIYMRHTGQGIRVGPDDVVSISYAVMRVERSFRNTP